MRSVTCILMDVQTLNFQWHQLCNFEDVFVLPVSYLNTEGAFLWGDARSLVSWYIKGTDESSTLVTDSSVSLMNKDPSDLGSLILIPITPKERTLDFLVSFLPK